MMRWFLLIDHFGTVEIERIKKCLSSGFLGLTLLLIFIPVTSLVCVS